MNDKTREMGEFQTSAVVYIWLPTKQRSIEKTGHASLQLSDGTYISWISPSGCYDAKVDDIVIQTYEDDVEREGTKSDRAFVIKPGKLDENAIVNWWKRWNREEIWRLQMPVLPMYTIFEALSVGLKGFDGTDSKGIYLTHTHLIHYMKHTKIVASNGQCVIL